MASPFEMFRRNQKVLLTSLLFLAMIAFVFLPNVNDLIRTSGPRGDGVAVTTSRGPITYLQLSTMQRERQTANDFVRRAKLAVDPKSRDAFFPRFTNMGFSGRNPMSAEAMALRKLLIDESRRMGVVVDDRIIDLFIDGETNSKLGQSGFRKVCSDMSVSQTEVYNTLRDELAAETVLDMYLSASGRSQLPRGLAPSPEMLWRAYQQFNTKQRVALAAVPVSEFEKQLKEPSETELEEFFRKYRDRYPVTEEGTVQIGFKQPVRSRMQYLRVKYEDVEATVLKENPVTPQDVERYYADNKERYRNRAKPLPEGDNTPDALLPGGGPLLPPVNRVTPTLDGPETPTQDADPKSETKAPSVDAKSADEPKSEKEGDSAEEPGPAEEARPADRANPGNEAEPAEPAEPAEEAAPKQASRTRLDAGSVLSLRGGDELVQATASTDDEPAAATSPEKSAQDEPDADGEPAGQPGSEPAPTEAPEEPADDSTPTLAPPVGIEPPPDPVVGPSDPNAPRTRPSQEETPKELLEFRPLDDDLRSEIEDAILRDRTIAALNKLSGKILDDLSGATLRIGDAVPAGSAKPEDAAKIRELATAEMKKLASANNLEFAETDLLSFGEFEEMDGFGASEVWDPAAPMPTADSLDAMGFSGGDKAVRRLFTVSDERGVTAPDRLCMPFRAANTQGRGDVYIGWCSGAAKGGVYNLNDDGIRPKVLKAWKLEQARPAAQQRAEELARRVRESMDPMDKVLEKETVLGSGDGLPISVRETPQLFTWYTGGGFFGFQRAPVQITPGIIDNPGDEFMETIFDKLQLNEVGVASDALGEVFYVVKVIERIPANREAFAAAVGDRSQMFRLMPVEQVASQEAVNVGRRAYRQLMKQFDIKVTSDSDSEDGMDADLE